MYRVVICIINGNRGNLATLVILMRCSARPVAYFLFLSPTHHHKYIPFYARTMNAPYGISIKTNFLSVSESGRVNEELPPPIPHHPSPERSWTRDEFGIACKHKKKKKTKKIYRNNSGINWWTIHDTSPTLTDNPMTCTPWIRQKENSNSRVRAQSDL